MRVRRFGTPDDLICEEVPDPVPNPRQVVIATEAVGVHFADLLMIAGRYQVRPEPPLTPGFEAAGRVIALGSEVDQVGLGDLVGAQPWYGAYAEQVAVDANRAYPVPEGVDPAVAAAGFVAYATAHHALFDRAGLRSGETLLVSGATGGVGTAAVQIGVASGATVIAAVGDPAKETPALLLGATHAVRYGGPVSLEDAVGSFTAGRGADVVLDVVGREVLALTHDEEVGSFGAKELVESWQPPFSIPRATIVGEPTQCRLVRMHTDTLVRPLAVA
ncbi:MAG: alcohol dehydrogenase catalytic domain-containing protein, partial [Acidimicrobiia bacterium]